MKKVIWAAGRGLIMARYKKAERNGRPAFEEGSGNIFIDLGFPEHEAVNILTRLKLMMQIESHHQRTGLYVSCESYSPNCGRFHRSPSNVQRYIESGFYRGCQ